MKIFLEISFTVLYSVYNISKSSISHLGSLIPRWLKKYNFICLLYIYIKQWGHSWQLLTVYSNNECIDLATYWFVFHQLAEYLQDLEQHCTLFLQGTGTDGGAPRKKSFISTHRALVKCQEIGDEKLALLSVITEHIENRTRLLEQTRENLGK